MNPWLALALVLVATATTVVLVRYVYGEERHRTMNLRSTVLLTGWFLVSYGVMAFLIRPH